MTTNNSTETISYRKKVYIALKAGKTIEEINAKNYKDYKEHADFFGVLNEDGSILDEVNNRSYSISELLSSGYYDIINSKVEKTRTLFKTTYDIVYFLRPCTVIQLAVYKDKGYLGGFSGYIRSVEKSGDQFIREPKKLFDALGFNYKETSLSYLCLDADSNGFRFPKETYYNEYSTSISIPGLISGFKSGNYECSATAVESETNIVRLDITSEGASKGSGKEQWFSTLDEYLEGNISDTGADKALTQIAGTQTLDVYISASNSGNKNYERYDNYIIGWTEYFNDRLGININTAIIKAMLWKESKMGYAQNSSPNANISADVMQVLDPRNPTIYEYCTYNLDTTTNVKIIGVTGTYVFPITVNPTHNHQKTRTTYNTPVADRLFSLQSDGCYHYQYQNSSPLLSIALGIKTYTIKLQVTNGNALLAVQEYNGNTNHKVQYMNDVNMLAFNGGFGNADLYP